MVLQMDTDSRESLRLSCIVRHRKKSFRYVPKFVQPPLL